MNRRHRVAFLVAAVAVAVVLGGVVAVLAGVTIDASRWRDAAAQRVAAALGRPVVLGGAFELKLGRQPGVRIGHVKVLNPPGFTQPEFLTIGELRAGVDLLDALRGRWRLRFVDASDVVLRLERGADGRGNWTSTLPGDRPPTQAAVEVDRVVLRDVGLHYHDVRPATRRFVALDELFANAARDAPLRIAARSRVQPDLPAMSLRLEGGALQQLLDDAEPWPFTLDLKTRGATLHASGALAAGHQAASLKFDAQADDLGLVERLSGARLPHVGGAALHGTLDVAPGAIELTELKAWLGESEVSGRLAIAFDGERPRLSGALDAATLDLRPWLTARPQARDVAPDEVSPRRPLALRDLSAIDAEVDLAVDRCLGLDVDLRDARFAWRSDGRGVRVPMSATLAGAALAGSLEIDTAAAIPTLEWRVGGSDVGLGGLVAGLANAGGIEGTIGRLDLRAASRGETLASLASDLELSLAAADARLRIGGADRARLIDVRLDTLDLELRRGERLRGHAHGTLLGERARLAFGGGTVADMLRGPAMPLDLELALAQIRLRVEGTFPVAGSGRETALRFDLRAPRSGDLARWLDVAPQSSLPVALRGRLRVNDRGWTLEPTTLQLGRSDLTVAARRGLADGRPWVTAAVRSSLIDVPQLSTLRGGGEARRRSAVPVFPATFDPPDADVTLELRQVKFGRTALGDLDVAVRTRDGRPRPMSVTGTVAGAPFTARVELDLQGELPTTSLDLSTGAVDLGALLRGLGVADDIEGQAQSVHVKVLGRGSTMRELAEHSSLEASVRGGSVSVLGAARRPVADIRVDETRIGAAAGAPVSVRLAGALDQTPVRIDFTSGTLGDFLGDASVVPFALAAQAAHARLRLEGAVQLPLGSAGRLNFEMDGERLDTLSELARVELPAWGPWSIRGPIRTTSTGYELQGLAVSVGQSQLGGSATLDLSGPRPRLQMLVAAKSIQLDDFPPPQRLADPPDPSDSPGEGEGLRAATARLAGRIDRLLSARFLRRFDATIDVKADEVLSGVDRLGDGAVHLKLQDGRLDLNPVVVNLPGGSMRLAMVYDLKESAVDFQVAANVERFDYGIIARRLNRADDLRGLFDMRLELSGGAPSLDSIMRNASGRLDIAVWPTELRSGIFNLWSANLVLTLLPLVDPGLKSQVNCIVGRFDLKDGDLSDDKMLIDTSTVRIRGTGHANLKTEELAFVFRPRAKGLGLFRLQTPLRVSGTLTDQRFGFDRQDVVFSVLRAAASPILVPVELFTLGPQPRDGADVCTDPLRSDTH